MRKVDRRINRTQQALRTAFIELIIEKGYEKVTVQEIVRRADVGRTTFYAHYLDKDDLLRVSFTSMLELIEATFIEDESIHLPIPSLGLYQHFAEMADFARAIARRDELMRVMQRTLVQHVVKRLKSHPNLTKTDFEYMAEYIVGGFLSIATRWLNDGMLISAEDVNNIFLSQLPPQLSR